jgi:uncharacterized repeat protein (TIGR03803 family)
MRLSRIFVLSACALVAAVLAPRVAIAAATESILYSFCTQNCSGESPTDGVGPEADLLMDKAGNLYGTTLNGGYQAGTVFELTPNQDGTVWNETVIHAFCAEGNCGDGLHPKAGLVMDAAGNLYGTTGGGGANNNGVVFRLSPNEARTEWTETVLYGFCARPNCTDGALAAAGLIMDGAGNLYGTTQRGGGANAGVAFELTPSADKTGWRETVLYSFCAQPGCADGADPIAGLRMDAAGRLYGTTFIGGSATVGNKQGNGVAFMLTPNGAGREWSETVLHTFCQQQRCPDGLFPEAGLITDGAGNLYGTTASGGGGARQGGVVFRLSPGPAGAKWSETVLHRFCGDKSCADGNTPVAGLTLDGAGNLYGTTSQGGAGAFCCGVAFKLSPGAAAGWTETVLHRFSNAQGLDGYDPKAGLIMGSGGSFYGTTSEGGTTSLRGGVGTVYRLSP